MGSVIRLAAILTSIVVLLGFAFFAVDEMDKGSKTQQSALAEGTGTPASPEVVAVAPTPGEEAARERRNGGARELIDDANDVLLAPFANLIDSDNGWVTTVCPPCWPCCSMAWASAFWRTCFPRSARTTTTGARPTVDFTVGPIRRLR